MREVMRLIEWPISLYGNIKTDILYIDPEMDDLAIFERHLDEWLTPAARAKGGIKHMAIEKAYWKELDPGYTNRMLDGEEDYRLKLGGLEGLRKVTFVLNDYDIVDIDDDAPPLDGRRLLMYPEKEVRVNLSKVLENIARGKVGWRVEEMGIGRVVYD